MKDTFVRRFLAQAAEHPKRPAVMDIRGAWTYQELNRRSAVLAAQIRQAVQEKPARVALLFPRTKDFVLGELAVLRAGCAMVPIDGEYPAERVQAILEDSECALCLTVRGRTGDLGGAKALVIEDVFPEGAPEAPETDLTLDFSDPEAEGCLLYTSGSTGRPKGVVHRQRMLNYPDVLPEEIPLSKDTRTLCIAGFSFVACQVDLVTPLIHGGSVYIASEEERKNLEQVYALFARRGITGMFMPPSMYSVLRRLHGPLPLQYVLLGGEKVDQEDTGDAGLWEIYGSTELSIMLIHPAGQGGEGSLGKPRPGIAVYLTDEKGKRIEKPGEIGECCIASPYAAIGYNHLPQETAKKFISDPSVPGGILVHTGDYMAFDAEGNLVFHGRQDRMVKVRGYRVELDEVEHALERLGSLEDVAAVNVTVNGGEKICCYYTGKETSPAALKALVSESLPEYMVPEFFIHLDSLPLNDRGKTDYKRLKARKIRTEEGDYEPPATAAEQRICDAFARVLDLQKVSALADFFELGGTSLSAAVLVSRLSEKDDVLSFQDVSTHPTPRDLAKLLESRRGEAIPPMDRTEYPLTKTQLGIWLESLTGGSKETYSSPYLTRAATGVTAEELIAAARRVIDAHPAMKYIIRKGQDGLPRMVMAPEAEVEIPVVDGTEDGRLDFMEKFHPVVPIMDGLLFRMAVYRTPERCYLALKFHLIFFDGTSISRFIAEMNRALRGEPLAGEKCTIQQAALIEERQLADGTHAAAEKYYADLFQDAEDVPALSGDLEGPLTPGVSQNLRYEQEEITVRRVRTFCDSLHISESSFFQGAMALMLGKYLNSRHVSFSTVYNGRTLAEMDNTLGTLIKRIPVYGDLRSNLRVEDYLRGISRQIFTNMAHDIYSFDEVLKACPVNEDVEFIYQGDLFTDKMGEQSTAAGGPAAPLLEGDSWFMEEYHTGMVTGCLSIQMFATAGLYNMTLEYRNEKFSEKWVRRFAQDLFKTASGLLRFEFIGEVYLMTEEDQAQQDAFNNTRIRIPFIPVHEQILYRALENPEKTAVIADGKQLTFRQLDALSSRLAAVILDQGVGTDELVGVLFDRDIWAYVAEIAVLKAGAGFMPFIPEYPNERIRYCLRDSDSHLLLTTQKQKESRGIRKSKHYQVLTLEEAFGAELDEIDPDEEAPDISFPPVERDDLAYCIYTSGSTGKPKGVMIEHRNIANYVNRNKKSIEIMHYAEPGRICLALASFSFDVSVVEEFVPLCNGNTVVIATETEIHEPAEFARLVRENGVTGITCTPTYLLSLMEIPESREALRQITFFDIGAEAFPRQLYDRLRELREDSVILNVYGPTECTMGCAAAVMTEREQVTVGGPIANTAFFVADTFGNPLPVGMKGELIICGDQVGRGYVNPTEKNAKAFFHFGRRRAYHSGDLAAWTEDGEMRIFGRIDNQIKLRGFRIELDEIEKTMAEFPGVSCAAVAVRKSGGTEYLAGYYTAGADLSEEALKKRLQEKLPEYMVPSLLMRLEEMPMTVNGKVNRRALPEPDLHLLRAEYVAPVTDIQKKLCAAFARTLKLPEDQVGLLDDFFDLGGDSLKAMLVLSEADLDSLTGADVFHLRTPGAIAEALEKRRGQAGIDERDEKARRVPHLLTPMQTEMIDNQLFRPGSTMWSNTHFLLRFDPSVDAQKLCDAVNRAIANHPGLSVAFYFNEDNELRQKYVPGLVPKVEVRDIRPETEKMLPDVLVLPFNRILNACLCKVNVFRGRKNCYLFMDVHHLLMDGGSLGVILQDIVHAYYGRKLKRDYYFALMAEEEQKLAAGALEADRAAFFERYGREEWCEALPPDHPDGAIGQAGRMHRLSFRAEQIQAAEERWGVTLSVMAIAAGLIALSRTTGEPNVMANWIFNNRLSPESENVVGMLIKNMPASLRMEDVSSMQEALLAVRDQVTWALAHTAYDFMADTRQPYVNDCIEINLQMSINGEEMDALPYELVELDDPFTAAGARLELELLENEFKDGGYDSEMEYAEGLYDAKRMEAFHDLYIQILEDIVAGRTEQYFK